MRSISGDSQQVSPEQRTFLRYKKANLNPILSVLGAIACLDHATVIGRRKANLTVRQSPESVPPSEYLPVIFGSEPTDSGAFADLEDANLVMSLLMRYWNSIIADLERESIHLSYIVKPGTDGIVGREWARGFLLGTRLAPEGWSDFWESEGDGQIMSIPLVAGELEPEWPGSVSFGFTNTRRRFLC